MFERSIKQQFAPMWRKNTYTECTLDSDNVAVFLLILEVRVSDLTLEQFGQITCEYGSISDSHLTNLFPGERT